ncbi:MAG: hypothetical protein AB8G16_01765, partial [Gammaproteobacteria bacterium]
MIARKIRKRIEVARARFGAKRVNAVGLLLIIGVASIVVRLLFDYRFHTSALLYIGVPYLVSVLIALLRPKESYKSLLHEYRDDVLKSLMVMLGSSILLFEGFVCVAFFLPILLLIQTAAFLIRWARQSAKKRRGSTFVSLVPVLIVLLSLEGT